MAANSYATSKILLLTVTSALALNACAEEAGPIQPPAPRIADAGNASVPQEAQKLPTLIIHKSASCVCCGRWADHMRHAGFAIEVRERHDLQSIKARLGVPANAESCHTAEIGGYFIEGHVPARDIKRLLASRPDALGISVPGMPGGSPGMESPSGKIQPYAVWLIDRNGGRTEFATYGH